MKGKSFFITVLLFIGALVLSQSLFTVDQTEQAIVIQLGKPWKGPTDRASISRSPSSRRSSGSRSESFFTTRNRRKS